MVTRPNRRQLAAPLRQMFVSLLQSAAGVSVVTLVYGARDTQQNAAVVLRDYLLGHRVARSAEGGNTLVVLAAVAAVAAAQPSGGAPVSSLAPFIGSSLAAGIEPALQTLHDQGLLQTEQGRWRLTSRGERLLRQVPGVSAAPSAESL